MKRYSSEENIALRSVKCILTGLPGVGKTTFLRRLSEDIVNISLAGEESCFASTGVEPPLHICVPDEAQFSTAVASSESLPWKIQRSNEESASVTIALFSKPQLAKDKTPDQSSAITTNKSMPKASKVVRSQSKGGKLSSNKPKLAEVTQYVSHVLKTKGISSIEELKKISMVYLIDTGGQPEFHEILPVLLQGSALHLVFFSLAQELYDKVHVCYRLPSNDKRSSDIEYDACHSSVEMIHQLLSSFYSIHSRQVESSSQSPSFESHPVARAVLLATYADHIKDKDKEEKFMKINEELKKWLECEFDKKFLTYSNTRPLIFTPIDNMNGSKEEIKEVEKFLTPIIKSFPEVNLPLPFALFHLILQHKFAASGVCSINEAIRFGIVNQTSKTYYNIFIKTWEQYCSMKKLRS